MRKRDIKKFQDILLERKNSILNSAESLREKGISFDKEELPDEVDLASAETGQFLNLKLHGRELTLLKKIDKTLKKIDDGEFGICERCGEEIGLKRLEARPVAEVCIRCKEELEKKERGYAD